MKITQDILSVTDFKKNLKGTLDQMRKTHRPVILTVNGKADAVVMDAAEYERQQEELELVRRIMKGEEDYATGKVRSARAFIKEFKSANKI